MRLLLFLPLTFLIISISCGKNQVSDSSVTTDLFKEAAKKSKSDIYNDSISQSVIFENDSIIISMKFLPTKDEWSPCQTEILTINKKTGDSKLIVKSNPDSLFGRILPYKYENDYYRIYPIDSIPTISRCIPIPQSTYLIIEGPTCDSGWMATFKIDWQKGKCYVLPSNDGFREFEKGTNNIIVASRFNDIDYDLVIWYEELSIISPNGKIIKKTSTKNQEIENHLPFLFSEIGFSVDNIKLLNHKILKSKYSDEKFWGNRFDCKFSILDESHIKELDSLVDSNTKWGKFNSHYRYEYLENSEDENKVFLMVDINPKTKTGIVYKGMFSDKRAIPSFPF